MSRPRHDPPALGGRGPLRPPWVGPLGLHHPGETLLHRLAPAPKLGLLAAVGVAVLLVRGPYGAGLVLTVVALVAVAARLPWRATVRALLPVLLTAGLVAAYQGWQRGPDVAVEVAADLVTVVLAATVVTSTTPADRLLDTITRAARPLRHVGLPPETVGLAVGLMLRSIPALVRSAVETRDAARARGLERDPRAVLVPAAVRAVGRARRTGDALAARGIGD